MLLLCQGQAAVGDVAVDRHGDRVAGFEEVWWRLEESPDAAGEVALEAAQGFAAGLAFGLLAREVGGGLGIETALADGEAVQRAVELAVAAAVEAVAVGAPGGGRDRCRGSGPRELGVGGEAADAGDLADQLGGGQRAAAAFGQQLRREFGDEAREFSLERVDGTGELADAAQLVTRDPHLRDLFGAREPTGDALLPVGVN